MIRLAVPGALETPTGGYAYARRLLETAGAAMAPLALPGGFPFPSKADLAAAAAALRVDAPLLIDGLAYGVLPPALIRALPRRPVALVHHPLGFETGLAPAKAARLIAAERAALAEAAHVIATSAETRATLIDGFGLAHADVTVAPPGVDRPANMAAPGDGPPVILTVASLTPRKGHDTLTAALAQIADLDWRAVWIGPEDRAPDWADRITEKIAAAGLAHRIERRGAQTPSARDAAYGAATLFCLPSRYEGYGMAQAEAAAHGLPIVACPAPSLTASAARLVPPDDPAALAGALRALLTDPATRASAAAAARNHGLTLPVWDATWTKVRKVMETFG